MTIHICQKKELLIEDVKCQCPEFFCVVFLMSLICFLPTLIKHFELYWLWNMICSINKTWFNCNVDFLHITSQASSPAPGLRRSRLGLLSIRRHLLTDLCFLLLLLRMLHFQVDVVGGGGTGGGGWGAVGRWVLGGRSGRRGGRGSRGSGGTSLTVILR